MKCIACCAPGCEAVVVDLCKDASFDEIDTYVRQSGRSRIDAWITKWTFRHVLLKHAYRKDEFVQMAHQSRFGACQITVSTMALEVRFAKPGYAAVEAS